MSGDWHVLIEDHRTRVEVAEWAPGDGLGCTIVGGRPSLKVPCGPAVALVGITDLSRSRDRRIYRACKVHLANKARQASLGRTDGYRCGPMVAETAAIRAREEVLVHHWDEYQAALKRYAVLVTEEWLAPLPDKLRALVEECESEGSP